MLRCVWGHFLRVVRGASPTLSHSSSLLHSLGSVTVSAAQREGPAPAGRFLAAPGRLAATEAAPGGRGVGGHAQPRSQPWLSPQVLCCVDKQGILSWPNPSPETVLFFSGKVGPPHSSHEDLTDDLSARSFCHHEGEEEVRRAALQGRGEEEEGGLGLREGSAPEQLGRSPPDRAVGGVTALPPAPGCCRPV